jgi:hypothetical protein
MKEGTIMKAPSRSALVVVLGVMTGAACGIKIAAGQGAETGVTHPMPPGACGAAIGLLETALNEARARGRAVATARESVGAMLHHQPTRDSVAKAQSESFKRVEDSLATARDLRSQGKRSECVSMLEKIALSAGIR